MQSVWQEEKERKEQEEARKKQDEDAKKKKALTNMTQQYGGVQQRVSLHKLFTKFSLKIFCQTNVKDWHSRYQSVPTIMHNHR